MRSVTVRLDDLRTMILNLGYVGENEHRTFNFDCKKMFGEYPSASVSLTVQPPAGDCYPATVERDGDLVSWTVTDSDLIEEGYGEVQLTFMVGDVKAKTCIGRTKVERSLGATGDIPTPIENWIEQAEEVISEAEAATAAAEDAAEHQPIIVDGYWNTWDADQGAYVSTGVKAQGEDGAAGPKGDRGETGPQGPQGIPGDPTELIDDEAGEGDTDKVWSADKSHALLTEINSKVDSSLMQSCKIVKIGASANLWNKDDVSTGLYYKNGNIYTGGSYDNYRYNNKKISVEEGDVLSFYVVNSSTVEIRNLEHIACFTANGTVDANKGISNTPVATFTIPSGIASVIINANISWSNFMVLKNAESAPTEYISYSEGQDRYVAKDEFIPEDMRDELVGNKVDKDGIKQIKGKNCEFVSMSPNLYDPSAVVVGLLNKATGVVLDEYTNYRTSDWIEVEGSTDYTFSSKNDPYIYWVWYDSSKNRISGYEKSMSTEPTKQSPENAKYIRFSIIAENVNTNTQFEKGSNATSFRGFGTGYIVPEYMPPEETGIVLNIPKKVYALVGYETNIYFENLVEDWTKYKWDVSCTKGMQMERGFRITPVAGDVGSYTLTFHLSVGNHVEQFSTTLVVVSASAGSGVSESLIILGDSTTANSIAVTKLNANLDSDVYSLSTIGTKGTSPNNHEGRSGWRFSTYFSNDADNAFYNPTSQTFDASYYFTNSGVSKPDWFFINLGINDVFGSTNDSYLDTAIDGCVTYCDSMIESILEASPSTKIGICLTIPPNHSQDAFGKEYKCGQNRNRYKRNNLLWVHSLIEEYDDREDEGIYLIPIHAVLDTVYNMGFETIPVNARNTAITYESPIGNGGVHPVESGYWQIADQYTAFLKGNASA